MPTDNATLGNHLEPGDEIVGCLSIPIEGVVTRKWLGELGEWLIAYRPPIGHGGGERVVRLDNLIVSKVKR